MVNTWAVSLRSALSQARATYLIRNKKNIFFFMYDSKDHRTKETWLKIQTKVLV